MIEKFPTRKLFVLILFGVLFIFLFLLWSYEDKKKNEPIGVWIAAKDIPQGVFLRPEMAVKSQIPTYLADPDNIDALHEVDGLATIISIPKGKPLKYTQFAPTEKNQSSILGRNPQNYTLSVDDKSRAGKLFKPDTTFYFSGNVNKKSGDVPVAEFPLVKFIYRNLAVGANNKQPPKPIYLFSITPNQAETLKALDGKPLNLYLSNGITDEVVAIDPLENSQKP